MLTTTVPTPHEIGLPAKFSKWRNGQSDAIHSSMVSDKRFDVVCAPTGFGKSPCYVAMALLSGGRACIVTSTKGLQEQLMDDFGPIGLVDIRGKANYQCASRPGWTCEDGHSGGCTKRGSSSCCYSAAYNAARTSRLVVTNYKYWIAVHKYGLGLGKFDIVIFDEAHGCLNELADSLQVRISHHEVEEMLGSNFPATSESDDGSGWKCWASHLRVDAEAYCANKLADIGGSRNARPSLLREYNHGRNLVRKLAIIALMRACDWVWEEQDWGWQFDPVRTAKYAESYLFMRIPKVMLTSATVRPRTLNLLGVKTDNIAFHDYPSSFPPERSPVYQVPAARVDFRLTDHRAWVLRMDQIMGTRLNRKGIIHTVSFARRDEVIRNSKYREFMISNWDGEPVDAMVKRFKVTPPPAILVSPSVMTGYDFPASECRFQIIGKVPFPDSRSKVIKARQKADNSYGPYAAMQNLVQACGRGCRSEDDWCESAIVDDHAAWFVPKFAEMAPKSFRERYTPVCSIPRPLNF